MSERLSALWQLKSGQADVLFVPVSTAMQKLAPLPFMAARTFWLKAGQTLNIEALRESLVEAGYSSVTNVVATGEFAVRGGILRYFPDGQRKRLIGSICLTMKSTASKLSTPTASARSRR